MKNKIKILILFQTLYFFIIFDIKLTAREFDYFYDGKNLITNQIIEYIDSGSIAGAQLVIIKSDSLIYNNAIGYADIDSKKLLSDDSIFRIYSMTKPIVSVALMMLWEKGLFNLDDYLHEYIPGFKDIKIYNESTLIKSTKKIKIIDLLRHTSGLGYGWSGNKYLDSEYSKIWISKNNEEFALKAQSLPLFFEPGTSWRYGINTDICGYLIEILSNQSLDLFLYENIFKPMEMIDTHFQIPDFKIPRFTSNYKYDEKKEILKLVDNYNKTEYSNKSFYSGGGGLVSTVNDYINFSKMLLNNGSFGNHKILEKSTIQLMTKNQIYDIDYPWGNGIKFGLGFSVVTDHRLSENSDSNGSFGWSGAAGTRFIIDPKEELIIIMMIQRMYPWPNLFEKLNNLIYSLLKIKN